MKITRVDSQVRTLRLTGKEMEVMRLLVRQGSVHLKADHNVDRVTQIIAEQIVQEILRDSDSATEGG